jgi:parvulin-like peptidyl-prolyl isomerase
MNEAPEQQVSQDEQPVEKNSSGTTSHGFLRSTKGKIALLVGLVVVLLIVGSQQMYARPVTDGMVRFLSKVFPYPAIVVGDDSITFKEFLSEYDALTKYFEESDPEGMPPEDILEVAIADTIVNKLAVRQIAADYGVEIDADQVEAYYQDLVSTQESEEAFLETVHESYGWTIDEFRERIIESIVLTLQMSDVILEDEESQAERRALIEEAYSRVVEGEVFEVVAFDVHSGFSGIESDLGYVNSSIIPDTWFSAVDALEDGEMTEILELPEGFAIFKLVDKIIAGEETQLHLLTITVPKVTLEDVLAEYLETVEVLRHVGEV